MGELCRVCRENVAACTRMAMCGLGPWFGESQTDLVCKRRPHVKPAPQYRRIAHLDRRAQWAARQPSTYVKSPIDDSADFKGQQKRERIDEQRPIHDE